MNYTDKLTLIKTIESKDNMGNIITTETSRDVYAMRNKVGSNEFYNAVGVGITPTAELQIKQSNYDDEKIVEYCGKRYSVIRTIPKNRFDIVLVIGVKEGTIGN